MRKPKLMLRVMTIMLALGLVIPLLPNGTSASGTPLQSAAAWLATQQQPSGGFKGLTGKTDPGTTADAVVALAAAGENPVQGTAGKHTAIEYLTDQAPAYATSEAGAVKLLQAAAAAGANPRSFGGVDLITAVQRGYQYGSGMFDKQLYIHADAILALAAAGVTVPQPALQALVKTQGSDGGWAFTGSTQPGQADSNTTAVVLQALVATHSATPKLTDAALRYLRTTQTKDGAFAYQPPAKGTPFASDANSTAIVVQAIIAAGQDPNSSQWHHALDALRKFQNADGALRYQQSTPADNLLATLQAIPALAGKALPIRMKPQMIDSTPMQAAMAPAESMPNCRFFPQTKHNLCGNFLTYWSKFGGLAIYGYPISETLTEHGLTVQYFQRARFELHLGKVPQRDQVLLGLLGDQISQPVRAAQQQAFAKVRALGDTGCLYFGKTSHDICGPFETFWTQEGGLLTFGYPISQPFTLDGMTVQYFERTRFEAKASSTTDHPEVTLPLIGTDSLAEHK